jgi:ABC-type phosphate transport system substrate-binding protein
MMLQRRSTSVATIALLFALSAVPRLQLAFSTDPVLAQTATPSFPLPSSVPSGTGVRIDGSTSMVVVNQALKQRFEQQYSGTTVTLDYQGSKPAIQAVLDGTADLAAIGRPLTDEEKAQGLIAIPVRREKIAMIVGADNPFKGSLTGDQFAQIFRGEITNWSQVGGSPGPIRLIDRPEDSDTRQALRNYPVFQSAPFQTGATATRINDDTTDTLVQALGTDGISYTIASQAINRPGVRVVAMHQTLPDDPRYPFSQPLSYIYKGPTPTPAVAAFLGFATAAPGQAAIADAKVAEAAAIAAGVAASPTAPGATALSDVAASPSATASPGAVAPTATVSPSTPEAATPAVAEADRRGGAAWLWLLPLLAALGGLLWWLKGRGSGATAEAEPPAPSTLPPAAAPPVEPTLAERAGSVIAADRHEIEPPPPPPPPAAAPPAMPAGSAATFVGGAALAGAGAAALAGLGDRARKSRIVLTPRNADEAYAYWEAPEEEKAALRQQGGRQLTLRINDVTDLPPPSYQSVHGQQQFVCDEQDRDRVVPIPLSDRDYIAEIGYLTSDNRWLPLAQSNPVRVAPAKFEQATIPDTVESGAVESVTEPDVPDVTAVKEPETTQFPSISAAGLAGAAALAGAGAGAIALAELSSRSHRSRIVLTPRNADEAYAYWETPEDEKALLRQQGGRHLTLRLADVTDLPQPYQSAHSYQQFACSDSDQDRVVPIPLSDRDYVAEIGYVTDANDWLLLAQSAPVHVAPPRFEEPVTLPDQPVTESVSVTEPVTEPDLDTSSQLPDGAIAGAAALAAGAAMMPEPGVASEDDRAQAEVEAARFDVGQPEPSADLATVDSGLPDLPSGYGESQIILLPRDPHWAYAYWDVPNEQKQALRQQGGTRLALRFYDVTNLDLSSQNPHSLQQYDCDELARDWYIPVPVSDRDYIAEIGYVTNDGRWLMLARSAAIRIPSLYPSDWFEEQFTTILWDEDLRGQTFLQLDPSNKRSPIHDTIYRIAQATEAQRVEGSAFGSMQQVPPESVSSFVTASGAGMAAVPTESGVGMSGVGMSGVGISEVTMSGIGMSGVGMSSIGMSGIGMAAVPTESGIGMMSGIGMGALPTMSGIGMSGGMSGIGMSGAGMGALPTMSGIGMSGVGMSGVGMSGIGVGALPTMSGIGMSGIGMSGIGMSGIGMGALPTMSGIGMSGVGMMMSGIGMSGVGFSASMPPIRPRQFWLIADAELIVYGATEPDATVTIGGHPIQLNPDGTFRFKMSFQDGVIDYPIVAIAADGEQSRSIHMTFTRETPSRNTNTKDEAVDEWFSDS